MSNQNLRIITFNYMSSLYGMVSDWIEENGHQHVLAITTPGPKSRPTPSYKDVLDMIPRHVDTLVTTRLRTVATPLIRELKPDLILCYSFPYRITPEICAIPTYGAVNIHPSLLPAYRGPNPMRQFYDGAERFGCTAHWIAPDYDTGNVLSQISAEMPKIVTHATTVQWGQMMRQSIAEGVERAIAGDPGIQQDDSAATYAAKFTDNEKWVNFDEPSHIVLRKIIGLNLTGGHARAQIDGEPYHIECAEAASNFSDAPAGEVIRQDTWGFTIATGDGAVRMQTQPFSPNTTLPAPLAQEHFTLPYPEKTTGIM